MDQEVTERRLRSQNPATTAILNIPAPPCVVINVNSIRRHKLNQVFDRVMPHRESWGAIKGRADLRHPLPPGRRLQWHLLRHVYRFEIQINVARHGTDWLKSDDTDFSFARERRSRREPHVAADTVVQKDLTARMNARQLDQNALVMRGGPVSEVVQDGDTGRISHVRLRRPNEMTFAAELVCIARHIIAARNILPGLR